MYGTHVHEAVHRAFLAGQTAHTGMTIHRVNERYDEGPILFQARLEIEEEDTPASLAARVLRLEHRYYPQILQSLLEVDAQRQAAEEAAEVTPSMP
jgi:phosphoribosylglycinamide formyltransferase-1